MLQKEKNYDHFNSGHSLLQKEKKMITLTLPLKSICQNEPNIKLLDCQEFHIISLSKLDENYFKICLLNLGFNNQCYFNCLTSFPYISEELFTVGKTDIGMLKNLKTTINKM